MKTKDIKNARFVAPSGFRYLGTGLKDFILANEELF